MKKLIFSILLAFLVAGVVGFISVDTWVTNKLKSISLSNGRKTFRISNENNPAKPERTFASVSPVKKFTYEEGTIFKWIARGNNIFILDAQTQLITQLDLEGRFVDIHGAKGGAPWEHEGVMSFEVEGDMLYTADNSKMIIKKGRLGSRSVEYYKRIKETFWDAMLLNNDKFIVIREYDKTEVGDFGFFIYDAISGSFLQSFDFRKAAAIEKKVPYLNVAYEGYLLRNRKGIVVYLCSKAGLFLSFDKEGNIAYVSQTIDKRPPPRVSVKKSGNITYYVKEPDLNINYSASLDDEALFILSLIRFKNADNLVVDKYDLSDGRYIESYEIPNDEGSLPTDILVTNEGSLWVLYENMNIVIFKF